MSFARLASFTVEDIFLTYFSLLIPSLVYRCTVKTPVCLLVSWRKMHHTLAFRHSTVTSSRAINSLQNVSFSHCSQHRL